jgi:hypothetical protein
VKGSNYICNELAFIQREKCNTDYLAADMIVKPDKSLDHIQASYLINGCYYIICEFPEASVSTDVP